MNEPTTATVVKKVPFRVLGFLASAALAATGVGVIATTASATSSYDGPTQVVHAKSLNQSCPEGTTLTGAHFVITQVVPDQPGQISVTVSGDATTVPLDKTSGQTAHYTLTGLSSDDKITDATAVVPEDWTGQFNLSHLICTETSTSSTTTTSTSSTTTTHTTPPTTTTTSTEHKLGLELSVQGCVGGESTALINGKLTGMVEDVTYTANKTPDSDPLPTTVADDGTFSLVAQTDGDFKVTVNGSDGSSVSKSVHVNVCQSTSTSSTTSSSTTHTSSTTGTHSSTTTSTTGNHTTPADVCPNISGNQSKVPAGMHKNSAGNCVNNVVKSTSSPSVSGPKSVTDYVSSSSSLQRNAMLAGGFMALLLAAFGLFKLQASPRRH